MPCVVADTSPLFYLAHLDRLGLLREFYRQVNVPESVWSEALAGGRRYPATLPRLEEARMADWIFIHPPSVQSNTEPALIGLDEGERQALSLALKLGADTVLIDEKRGRRAALSLGLISTGTAGILIEAKRRGLLFSVPPELRRLREETTFWIHLDDEIRALAVVGETPDSHPDFST